MASALRRDIGFVATMGSTVASWPGMRNAQFARWITSTKALSRYPGGVGYGFVADVPAARLAGFGRRLLTNPPLGVLPARRFAVIPSGARADYCMLELSVARTRIGEVLAAPFTLGDKNTSIQVHASIGIAIGPRASAEELLRDAIASNPESGALIHTLVQLGKTLGLETLAEGIEDTDHCSTSGAMHATAARATCSPATSAPTPSPSSSSPKTSSTKTSPKRQSSPRATN